MLNIRDLNLRNHLSAAIAFAFASSLLCKYELEVPNCKKFASILDVMKGSIINNSKMMDGFSDEVYEFTNKELRYRAQLSSKALCSLESAYYSVLAAEEDEIDGQSRVHTHFCIYAAADAVGRCDSWQAFTHEGLLELLPLILRYKIEDGTRFDNPEEVYELLSDEDKLIFVFEMGSLLNGGRVTLP